MISPFIMSQLFDLGKMGEALGAGKPAEGKSQAGNTFATLFQQARSTGKTRKPMGAGKISQATPGGHALIAQLKRSLLASGASLDKMVAGDKALGAMEKVLIGAGFDAAEVRNLMDELKTASGEKTGQNGIALSTLFEGISRLTEPVKKSAEPDYLDISAVPYLQIVLSKLGLTEEETTSVLNKVKVEGKGIDAGKLAVELNLMTGAGGKKTPTDAATASLVRDLMQRIGLKTVASESGGVDLKGLAAALEKFAGQKSLQGRFETVRDENGGWTIPATDEKPDGRRMIAERFSQLPDTQTKSMDQMPDSQVKGAWQQFVSQVTAAESGSGATAKSNLDRMVLPRVAAKEATLTEKGNAHPAPTAHKAEGLSRFPDSMENAENAAGKQSEGHRMPDAKADILRVQGEMEHQDSLSKTMEQERNQPRAAAATVDRTAGALFGDGAPRSSVATDGAFQAQRPSPAALPAYVLGQVNRQILKARLSNESEIRLQLKPASLGRLKLNIENTNSGIRVNIIAESSAARDMLLSHAGELKTALMDQGLRLDKMDVTFQAAFGDSMADAQQGGSDRSDGRKRFSGSRRIQTDTPADSETPEPVTVERNGALNLVA